MIVYYWEISTMNARCSIITGKLNSTLNAAQMNIEFAIKSAKREVMKLNTLIVDTYSVLRYKQQNELLLCKTFDFPNYRWKFT